MIAGNPRISRAMLAIAMGVLLLTMLGIVLVAMRKRTSPQPTPPLHPEASVNIRMRQSAQYEIELADRSGREIPSKEKCFAG